MTDAADYDAVVYDLDGTLVDLRVDWGVVASDVSDVFEAAGIDVAGMDLWDMLDEAETHGLSPEVETTIAEHEHDGARGSERLPMADDVEGWSVPVSVCSLNCEEACRIALETHGLASYVDAVVGRDSVGTRKPDPESLLAALRAVNVGPERALFVGDSRRDELTAERAGVSFEYVVY